MPKKKHTDSEDNTDSDISSLSDDGGKIQSKRAKKSLDTISTSKSGSSSKPVKSADGEELIDLTGNKYLRVSSFRNRVFVDIREFYTEKDSGKLKPGKKGTDKSYREETFKLSKLMYYITSHGIALNSEQWNNLKASMAEIDAQLKK